MEKLIELVVKCQKELKQGYPLWDTEGAIKNSKEILISKSFGFIKRLVENDKIDFDKCGLDIKDYLSYSKRYDKGIVMAENYDNDTFVVKEFYSPYEQLLMLLSISDTPIEELCEYLKDDATEKVDKLLNGAKRASENIGI